jgi:aminopeptidase N
LKDFTFVYVITGVEPSQRDDNVWAREAMSGGLRLTVTKCRALGFISVFIGSIMAVGLSVYFLARPYYPTANSCFPSPKRPLSQTSLGAGALSKLVQNVIRLPRTVLPRHYDVRLLPLLEKGNFTVLGRVVIDVQCFESTDRIVLHSSDIKVDLKSVQVKKKLFRLFSTN